MKFHWSGQSGQPSWLWGGNSASDMYLYNPSNFSVNYANSAGTATNAGNANTLGGYTAAQLISTAQSGIAPGSTVAVLTGTIAHGGTIPLPSGFTQAQCKWMVSLNEIDIINGHLGNKFYCSANANRVVTCYRTTRDDVGSYTYYGTANYIIIGVK